MLQFSSQFSYVHNILCVSRKNTDMLCSCNTSRATRAYRVFCLCSGKVLYHVKIRFVCGKKITFLCDGKLYLSDANKRGQTKKGGALSSATG